MEFDEDDLTQLAEGEFYATPRHVGRVHGGIANYLLQQHRLESRRQTGKNITFEEKDQAVVLSAVDRWKHPGLQAANDLAKDMGYLVEEADRFATWTILKRLERGESVPALYADEEFLRGVIYLILKRDSNPLAPTRAEYNEFLKMRGKSLVSAPLLSTGGMMQYSLHSVVPGMLAAARRCISERTIPKLKLYILAVLREEKERQGYMKLSRKQSEALLAEQRDILAALWRRVSGSYQRQARFERNGAGSGAVDSGWESRQRKGVEEKASRSGARRRCKLSSCIACPLLNLEKAGGFAQSQRGHLQFYDRQGNQESNGEAASSGATHGKERVHSISAVHCPAVASQFQLGFLKGVAACDGISASIYMQLG